MAIDPNRPVKLLVPVMVGGTMLPANREYHPSELPDWVLRAQGVVYQKAAPPEPPPPKRRRKLEPEEQVLNVEGEHNVDR